jgi:hypothetical protein
MPIALDLLMNKPTKRSKKTAITKVVKKTVVKKIDNQHADEMIDEFKKQWEIHRLFNPVEIEANGGRVYHAIKPLVDLETLASRMINSKGKLKEILGPSLSKTFRIESDIKNPEERELERIDEIEEEIKDYMRMYGRINTFFQTHPELKDIVSGKVKLETSESVAKYCIKKAKRLFTSGAYTQKWAIDELNSMFSTIGDKNSSYKEFPSLFPIDVEISARPADFLNLGRFDIDSGSCFRSETHTTNRYCKIFLSLLQDSFVIKIKKDDKIIARAWGFPEKKGLVITNWYGTKFSNFVSNYIAVNIFGTDKDEESNTDCNIDTFIRKEFDIYLRSLYFNHDFSLYDSPLLVPDDTFDSQIDDILRRSIEITMNFVEHDDGDDDNHDDDDNDSLLQPTVRRI